MGRGSDAVWIFKKNYQEHAQPTVGRTYQPAYQQSDLTSRVYETKNSRSFSNENLGSELTNLSMAQCHFVTIRMNNSKTLFAYCGMSNYCCLTVFGASHVLTNSLLSKDLIKSHNLMILLSRIMFQWLLRIWQSVEIKELMHTKIVIKFESTLHILEFVWACLLFMAIGEVLRKRLPDSFLYQRAGVSPF